MLDDVFVRKVVRDTMEKYSAEHAGRKGVAKIDVIQIVAEYGGGPDDVRAVMVECIKAIDPSLIAS